MGHAFLHGVNLIRALYECTVKPHDMKVKKTLVTRYTTYNIVSPHNIPRVMFLLAAMR
jgi:hypothetical protein